jgi:hypothetical protein
MNIAFLSWNKYVLGLRYRCPKLNSPIKLWQIIHDCICIPKWTQKHAKLIYCILFTWKRNKQLSVYLLLLIQYFAFWHIRTIVVWFNIKKYVWFKNNYVFFIYLSFIDYYYYVSPWNEGDFLGRQISHGPRYSLI